MYNLAHLEAYKEELATLQMEVSKLKAHCNYLREACHKIVNLDACSQDEGSYIASCAVKQTEEQSLAEHDEMVVERFKQSFSKAE